MQILNTEKVKAYDVLPFQSGTKQAASEGGDSFKKAVQKILDQKNERLVSEDKSKSATGGQASQEIPKEAAQQQAQVSEQSAPKEEKLYDAQLGELISLMMSANVSMPVINLVQPEAPQEAAAESQAAETPMLNLVSSALAAIPEKQVAQNAEVVIPKETTPRAAQAGEAANVVKLEKPEVKGEQPVRQQQTQTEKPVLAKASEFAAKVSEVKHETVAQTKETVKPEEPKEIKHEFAGFTKQETVSDLDKVYLKVGDGKNIDSAKFASDVSENILTKMSEGKQQFEIELMPQELGKILIKLVMQNGKAEIMMHCVNPKTQQLLAMNTESIRSIVEERTGLHTTVTVKEEAEQAQNSFDGRESREKHGGQDRRDDGKELSEAETEIFLNQLRLGLTEISA